MLVDTWHAIGDPHTCTPCAALDGHTWLHGSDHPHPPLHDGCRCLESTDEVPDPMTTPAQPTAEPAERLALSGSLALATAPNTGPRRYRCTLMAAGELRGHRLTIAPDVLQAAAPLFAAKSAFVDHPDFWSFPSVERLAGVFDDVSFETDRVNADLLLKATPAATWLSAFLDELVADQQAGRPAANVGLSAIVWIKRGTLDEDTGLTPIAAIRAVDSIDIVFDPASPTARFERILNSARTTPERTLAAMPDPLTNTPAATPPPAAPDPLAEYRQRFAQGALDLSLQASKLPTSAQDFVRQQFTDAAPSVAQIDAAIERQRDLIAKLSQENVITGFGNPLDRGARTSGMTTPLDEAQEIVNWMFGVQGARLPEPFMRNPANIYMALSGDHAWHGRFNADRVMFASANATTLADLAANALNKVLIQQWDGLGEYRWFEDLVTVQPHDGSTHDMQWLAFGGISNLPTVNEGGAYTELTVADSKEADSFVKYGGYVGITEEMLRKSQLAKIQAVPRALAVAAVRTRSSAIAAIFTANLGVGPTLDNDSKALFHADHANLATTVFDVNAWKAARLECWKQTELGSAKRLGFWPRFCLVPGDLHDAALIAFGYGAGVGGYPGTADNSVNPYAVSRGNDARPEVVAVPEWTDVTDWAYLVDPRMQPILQISYAQAPGGGTHPQPEIFSVATPTAGLMFSNDVLPVKVRDWFAYGVSTYRGIGKRNVAG